MIMNDPKIAGSAYYHQSPGSYPASHAQPQTVVVPMNSAPAGYRWSWCHFVTSVFSTFCCQPLGLVSLIMSLLAYTDHKSKDYIRARSKRNTALGLAIAAIMFGIVLMIIVLVVTINAANSRYYYTTNNYGK